MRSSFFAMRTPFVLAVVAASAVLSLATRPALADPVYVVETWSPPYVPGEPEFGAFGGAGYSIDGFFWYDPAYGDEDWHRTFTFAQYKRTAITYGQARVSPDPGAPVDVDVRVDATFTLSASSENFSGNLIVQELAGHLGAGINEYVTFSISPDSPIAGYREDLSDTVTISLDGSWTQGSTYAGAVHGEWVEIWNDGTILDPTKPAFVFFTFTATAEGSASVVDGNGSSPVPEPATLAFLGLGLVALAGVRARRRVRRIVPLLVFVTLPIIIGCLDPTQDFKEASARRMQMEKEQEARDNERSIENKKEQDKAIKEARSQMKELVRMAEKKINEDVANGKYRDMKDTELSDGREEILDTIEEAEAAKSKDLPYVDTNIHARLNVELSRTMIRLKQKELRAIEDEMVARGLLVEK